MKTAASVRIEALEQALREIRATALTDAPPGGLTAFVAYGDTCNPSNFVIVEIVDAVLQVSGREWFYRTYGTRL